ncbi:TPA: hypothetical protein PXN07_004028 [Yersinia enterocolitica]|uniref:hypothetical protein n=1 Tax=Yersinia sp. LJYL362 TaxID=3402108 RepID=UPI0033032822|nr:hypothetical protein [Yersinia enterocolitica]HDL7338721.1 hypothetical protein [Yersinia enterocolitica]
MSVPKKVTKSKAIADAVDSQKLMGDKANVETLVTDKSLATIEPLVNAEPLVDIDLSVTTTVLDSSSPLVDAEKLVVVEPLVTATSLATDESLATTNPLATGDTSNTDNPTGSVASISAETFSLGTSGEVYIQNSGISGNDSSAGTTVPNEGSDVNISDQSTPQKKTIVIFLGPYQRYSRGDKAGFSADYAETLVARNIACWPKDFAAKSKGNSHGYDFAI